MYFFLDHRWGILSLIPNILSGFGWNPGNRFLEWFGDTLEEATGNCDITFQQVSYINIMDRLQIWLLILSDFKRD